MGRSGARNQHTRPTRQVAPRHATHLAPVTATRVRNRARSRPGLATAFFPFSALMSALQFVRLFIAFIDHKVAYLYTRDARVRHAYVACGVEFHSTVAKPIYCLLTSSQTTLTDWQYRSICRTGRACQGQGHVPCRAKVPSRATFHDCSTAECGVRPSPPRRQCRMPKSQKLRPPPS